MRTQLFKEHPKHNLDNLELLKLQYSNATTTESYGFIENLNDNDDQQFIGCIKKIRLKQVG